jgi:hypothetical protein
MAICKVGVQTGLHAGGCCAGGEGHSSTQTHPTRPERNTCNVCMAQQVL